MTCGIHEGAPMPCRICAVKIVAILADAGAAIREWREARKPRARIEPEHRKRARRIPLMTPELREECRVRLQGHTFATLAHLTQKAHGHIRELILRGETAASIIDGSYRRDRKSALSSVRSIQPVIGVHA